MTARTAAEMYFNPDDLSIYIGEEKDNAGIWGLVISRGPRSDPHPFKLLVSSNETTQFTKEKAFATIESELRAVKKFGDELFSSTEYGLLKAVCCEDYKSKEAYVKCFAPVLEDSDINRIMLELKNETGKKKHQSATYDWEIWKERYPKESSLIK